MNVSLIIIKIFKRQNYMMKLATRSNNKMRNTYWSTAIQMKVLVEGVMKDQSDPAGVDPRPRGNDGTAAATRPASINPF